MNKKTVADNLRSWLRRLHCEERGATTLEWALLLAAVAIPVITIVYYGLAILAGHYGLVTTLNQMPFP